MSKNKKLFSGSIGGFKKSQVVEYIEELNRKAKMTKEESDYEITRLENELSELFEKLSNKTFELETIGEREAELSVANKAMAAELSELRAKCEKLESENKMLSDDVSNQRGIILAAQNENEAVLNKLALSEIECQKFKEKAEKYDADIVFAGGVSERAKAEASKILADASEKAANLLANAKLEAEKLVSQAKETAQTSKARALAESEAELAENMKKIRYLYKRREELLSAFRKIKDAAGGFYDNIENALSGGNE